MNSSNPSFFLKHHTFHSVLIGNEKKRETEFCACYFLQRFLVLFRTRSRDRTGTRSPSLVFETNASTYSATRASSLRWVCKVNFFSKIWRKKFFMFANKFLAMNQSLSYRGDPKVYDVLKQLNIPFDYYEHPEAPTVEIAMKYWKDLEAQHCKNLFFRNHKGNKHFLVILDCHYQLNIRELELRLKQGKLTFASAERMLKYLNIKPGSVSPFGLIHDNTKNVHVFLDKNLQKAQRISFHPNDNTASLVIPFSGFLKFLEYTGNTFEFLELYPSETDTPINFSSQ